jgi:hypothetical protein
MKTTDDFFEAKNPMYQPKPFGQWRGKSIQRRGGASSIDAVNVYRSMFVKWKNAMDASAAAEKLAKAASRKKDWQSAGYQYGAAAEHANRAIDQAPSQQEKDKAMKAYVRLSKLQKKAEARVV